MVTTQRPCPESGGWQAAYSMLIRTSGRNRIEVAYFMSERRFIAATACLVAVSWEPVRNPFQTIPNQRERRPP